MKDDLYHTVAQGAAEHGLLGPESGVLLMVSGGSDSTALAYLAAEARAAGHVGPLAMLHVNHKLRGQDAEDDARFVSELAQLLDIPLFLCEVDVAAEAARSNQNVEAVARRERYTAANEALDSLCRHECVPLIEGRIAMAHTADDRIENFYMRSIVGTGPGGFRSMKRRNGPVVRPLLDATRDELRSYIEGRAQAGLPVMRDAQGALWREDATNAHTDRFRAFVRHSIVPQAKEWSARMPATLTRTMDLIADEDDMLDAMADEVLAEHAELAEDGRSFRLAPTFATVQVPLARRVVVKLLKRLLGADERIDTASVEAVVCACEAGRPKSGYTANIQGNLAVSANRHGVLVEPMADYRLRRKRA